jgi:hypothetical protein
MPLNAPLDGDPMAADMRVRIASTDKEEFTQL